VLRSVEPASRPVHSGGEFRVWLFEALFPLGPPGHSLFGARPGSVWRLLTFLFLSGYVERRVWELRLPAIPPSRVRVSDQLR